MKHASTMLALLVCACGAPEPSAPSPAQTRAPPAAAPTSEPPAPDVGGTPDALSIHKLGPAPKNPAAYVAQSPAPTDAGEAFRRTRALELLMGGDIALHLPERAHDPGTAFDNNRVQDMAPPARDTRPKVLLSKPTVKGSLPVEVVRRILRRHLHTIRKCYDAHLVTTPQTQGSISLSWTVNAKGEVEGAEVVDTTFEDKALPKCMLTAAKTWSFPKPEDGDNNTVKARYALFPGDL